MNKFNTKVKHEDEDEDEEQKGSEYLGYVEQVVPHYRVTVYLDEVIKSPKYYRAVLNRIESLSEDDQLEVKVNTIGGDLMACLTLLNAIRSTAADVHCTIEGLAASAGSIIALNCPSVTISPYAMMMAHSAFGSSGGVLNNLVNHASFLDKQVRELMQDTYKYFLSDKELEELFLGREFWFDAKDMQARFEKRFEGLQKEYDESEEEDSED